MLEFILSVLIGFAITSLYPEYRWYKLKRHVIEAIEELNLWNTVNTGVPLPCDAFLAIIAFLDDHKYSHCFDGQGGAFKLFFMLGEIRAERAQEEA